jgi:trk system potassium uptake protein TrkH
LSTGLTGSLSDAGRAVIIAAMFMGRLGPITAFVALSRSRRDQHLDYPAEELLIG